MDVKECVEQIKSLEELIFSGVEDNINLAFNIAEGLDFNFDGWMRNKYGDILDYAHNGQQLREKNMRVICTHLLQFDSISYRYASNSIFTGKNLTEIPKGIVLYQNLTSLHLACNNLTSIPSWITKMKNLESIDLSRNNFEDIPKNLTLLPNLKELLIRENSIEEIPSYIKDFEVLEKLDIGYNSINIIPREFYEIPNLYNLNIRSNYLKYIPKNIINTPKLDYINAMNNPLKLKVNKAVTDKIKVEYDFDDLIRKC